MGEQHVEGKSSLEIGFTGLQLELSKQSRAGNFGVQPSERFHFIGEFALISVGQFEDDTIVGY